MLNKSFFLTITVIFMVIIGLVFSCALPFIVNYTSIYFTITLFGVYIYLALFLMFKIGKKL